MAPSVAVEVYACITCLYSAAALNAVGSATDTELASTGSADVTS